MGVGQFNHDILRSIKTPTEREGASFMGIGNLKVLKRRPLGAVCVRLRNDERID